MKAAILLRVAEAFAAADEETRQAIRRNVGGGKLDENELIGVLADRDHILRRLHALTESARQRLFSIRSVGQAIFDTAGALAREDQELLGAGLGSVVRDEDGPTRIVLPVDVLTAIHELGDPTDSPLVAWLADLDTPELAAIAGVHAVATPQDADDVAIASQVAAALLQHDELEHLVESLEAPFRDLLFWLVRLAPDLRAAGVRFPSSGPMPAAPERVLIRLGLVFETAETDGRLILPNDLADAIFALRDGQLASDAFDAYGELHATLRQSHVDRWPRGCGGNALLTARYRTLRGVAWGIDNAHPLDRLLVSLGAWDTDLSDVGPNAAMLLDAGSPEAFARGVLRVWLDQIDDEATASLLDAVWGQAALLATGLDQDPVDRDVSEPLLQWHTTIRAVKSHLLTALSTLPPGNWVDLPSLAAWWLRIYERVLWHGGGVPLRSLDEDPPGAPLHPAAFPGSAVPRLTEALRVICRTLLAPIGAAELDHAAGAIVVNGTALRVLRTEEFDYDDIWHDAQDYMGDDVDYLQPMPTDPGARVAGLAPLRWVDGASLVVPTDAHLFDLITLARYATPVLEGDAFRFDFVPVTEGGAEIERDDAEQLVRWLQVRAESPPSPAVRLTLGLRSAPTRKEEAERVAETNRYVSELLLEIESHGQLPMRELVEDLRSWGGIAVAAVLARVTTRVNRKRWSEPVLPVYCCLLGELGDESALPMLLRCIAFSDELAVEAAAAMAVARIGPRALPGLEALLSNEGAEPDKRLAACGALSAMSVLHPETMTRAVAIMERIFQQSELDPDVATLAALYIADTGSPRFEELAARLVESGLWDNLIALHEDAEVIVRNAPSVWGHPVFAQPLTWLLSPAALPEADWDDEEPAAAAEEPDPTQAPGRRRRRDS